MTEKIAALVGLSVICDDGINRVVQSITHSYRHKNRAVINEFDSDGGHFIHYLSAFRQLDGAPLPTEEEKSQFDKEIESWGIRE